MHAAVFNRCAGGAAPVVAFLERRERILADDGKGSGAPRTACILRVKELRERVQEKRSFAGSAPGFAGSAARGAAAVTQAVRTALLATSDFLKSQAELW